MDWTACGGILSRLCKLAAKLESAFARIEVEKAAAWGATTHAPAKTSARGPFQVRLTACDAVRPRGANRGPGYHPGDQSGCDCAGECRRDRVSNHRSQVSSLDSG